MSTPGRPKSEYRSAQHEGTPVSTARINPARSRTGLPAHRERGAAALVVTMLLFFAMVLTAVFVNRNLVFEQRSSANQYRATQAFEAAEAGLEWALAQLNGTGAIGDDCLPSGAASGGTSFRARHLQTDLARATFTPVTWLNAGTPTPLQPSCVRGASGWSCSCPAQGMAVLTAPSGAAPAPAFLLQFRAGPKPGTVRVVSTGCTRLAGACAPASSANADAVARMQLDLGLLGGVRTAPVATLTARGAVNAGTAAPGLHNTDPATGIAVQAGGTVNAAQARVTAPAGTSLGASLVGNDTVLANLSADRFFGSYFGLDKPSWRAQPTVALVDCRSPCAAALQAAVAAAAGPAMLWVEGDLALAGPLTLGTAQAPVVIVVNGAARLDGGVAINGLLYATTLAWTGAAGQGAVLRGAAIVEADYTGDGAPEFVYDPLVLAALKGAAGSFARVSGSWRDF